MNIINKSYLKLLYSNRHVIIADAEKICSGQYFFNNPWDMEWCDTSYFLVKKQTNLSPNKDAEWVYQYSRMEFLHKLVLAYQITEEKRFLEAWESILVSFFNTNSLKKNAQMTSVLPGLFKRLYNKLYYGVFNQPIPYPTYRTLDTAIRNYSILTDFQWIPQNTLDSSSLIHEKVLSEIDYPFNNLREFDNTSNWGIIIVSLTIASKLLIGYKKVRIYENKLINMLRLQIRTDGGHIENSLLYHMHILICLLRLKYLYKKYNIDFPNEIDLFCRKMCTFVDKITPRDGYQIMYGDSDRTSTGTVLYLASRLYQEEFHSILHESFDYILCMELPDLIEEESKNVSIVKNNQNDLLDGIWCFSNNNFEVRVLNEVSDSGHKHADNGEVILYYQNKPVLIDCGRCTYFDSRRRYYRGPMAHNICLIDNGEEWASNGNWSFVYSPSNITNERIVTKDFAREGYSGFICKYEFSKLHQSICREFYISDENVIVISKAIKKGKHLLQSIWNFSEDIEYTTDDLLGKIVGFSVDKIKMNTEQLFLYHSGDVEIREGKISYHYNEECSYPNTQLICSCDFVDSGFQIVVISTKEIDIKLFDEKIKIGSFVLEL